MYEITNEWEQAELEMEFNSFTERLKALWRRNKSKAQQLMAVAQIVGRLVSPAQGGTENPAKPPIEQKAYADHQRAQDRDRKDKISSANPPKPPAAGGQELEYEVALLSGELHAMFEKVSERAGAESILSEVLLETLETETYEGVKMHNWAKITSDFKSPKKLNYIKGLARNVARKGHFMLPERYQPIGVEVHHWIPFKYADLFPDYTLEQLNRLSIPLDAFTHVLIGAAIDRAAGSEPTRKKIEAVLDKLGQWRSGPLKLDPTYFNSVSDVNFLPTPGLSRNKQIGVIRQIGAFKAAFNLPRELELELINL
ncbi:hypothetical protein MUK70_01625 [Dyadobacter chenwenxiniae]|uniref:Uncharacterized protein n=1 Tax=Dyadobacter chenwenxiniae TaxID=2906456 RepID=A0A9X1PLQ6_9BACT|nr:hypothetical protein [Dyadobacter chenwenxiniae]MCF0062554.1 hypothetical protein [Dyadobacter chenwenxiniae]UON83702.1 hypothetical protein MUK70_01625 [Dyadobacter chenwenxiniae]